MSGWVERVHWRFRKRDKGSIILECVVSLGLLALLTLGYTSTSVQATITQRTAVNQSIATQAVQSELEKARATNWASLGTEQVLTSNQKRMLMIDPAQPFVTANLYRPVNGVSGGIQVSGATESRGLAMTLRTAVGWVPPASGEKAAVNVYDYGTKIVVVEASWQDVAGNPDTTRTMTQSVLITPGVGEAVPAGIRGAS